MSVLGQLFIELKANTAEFVSGMSSASGAAKRAGREIQDSFAGLGNIAGAALAPFGAIGTQISATLIGVSTAARSATGVFAEMGAGMSALSVGAGAAAGAIAAVGAGAIGLTVHTAESVAKMGEQARAAGVSVQALSGLSFVARQAGLDQDVMVQALERMSRSALAAVQSPNAASNAYRSLGVAVRDSSGQMRATTDIFGDLAQRFQAMPDGIAKTALAMQVFGRGGAQLIPVLDLGRAGVQEFLAQAQQLGIVLTDSDVRAADEFKQSLNVLDAAGQGVALTLERALLPSIQHAADGMQAWLADSRNIATLTHLADVAASAGRSLLNLADAFIFVGRAASAFWTASSGLDPFSSSKVTAFNAAIRDAWGEMQKFQATAESAGKTLADGFKAGEAAMRGMHGGGGGFDPEAANAAAAAQKKLQEELSSVTSKLKEEIATAGQGAAALEDYRLKALGAAAADLARVDALRQLAEQTKLNNDPNRFKINAPTPHDKSKDVQVDDVGNITDGYQREAAALDAAGNALSRYALDEEKARNSGEGLAPDSSLSTAPLAAMEAAIKKDAAAVDVLAATWGKSAQEIQIAGYQAAGASSAMLMPLIAATAKLKDVQEAAEKVSGVWKQLGDTIARDLSDMVTSSKKPLEALEGMVKGILKELEDLAIKQVLFGTVGGNSGSGGLFGAIGHAGGGSNSTGGGGGGGGLLSSIGKLFGLGGSSGTFTRDGNTAATASYVTPVDPSGSTFSVSDLTGSAGGESSPLSAISSIIPFLPGLAGGGPADAGMAYIVGENGPELFLPRVSGAVSPTRTISSGPSVNNYIDARGSTDPAGTGEQVRRAIAASQQDTIAKSIAAMKQINLRTPASSRTP